MPGTTTPRGYPYPTVGDQPIGNQQMQSLAQAVADDVDALDFGLVARVEVATTWTNGTNDDVWLGIEFNSTVTMPTGYTLNGRGIQVTDAGDYLVSTQASFDDISGGIRGLRVRTDTGATGGVPTGSAVAFGEVFTGDAFNNAHRLHVCQLIPVAAGHTIYVDLFATATPTTTTGNKPYIAVRRLA